MAPEVMFRQNHDHTSDYFAIGVLGYYMMTKKKPYDAVSREDFYQQILKKQI